MPQELPEGVMRKFYFPPPSQVDTDTFANAEELAKYLAKGADLGPLQGFINALLKTLQGDLTAIPTWLSEQSADWLDDFEDWAMNLGANWEDLVSVFEGTYSGDNVALQTLQAAVNTLRSLAGGLIDLARLPKVSLSSLTLTQPNLLLDPHFGSIEGEDSWSWDESVGRTDPGSAKTTGSGTRRVLTSNSVQSDDDQEYSAKVYVRWSGVSATAGPAFQLVASSYSGNTKLSDQVLGTVTSPAASAEWTELTNEFTTPAGTDAVRLYLEVTTNVTAGQVWFDDGELRRTATSLPLDWIKDLVPQLSGLWDSLTSLVNNALSALGITGSGSLIDRILDLADELGDMLGGIEDGAANFTNLLDTLLHNPTSLLGALPQSLITGLTTGLDQIKGWILSVINQILSGIRKVPVVGGQIADRLEDLLDDVTGLQDTVTTTTVVATTAQAQVIDLAAKLQALQVTQQWVSLSTSDIASFPRVLLGLGVADSSGSTTVSGTTGGGGAVSCADAAHSHAAHTHSFSNAHSHTLPNAMPTLLPGKGTLGIVPLVVDRYCRPRYLKLITGASGWSLFSIDYWYVGLYKYDPNTGNINKIFDGGDQKSAISSASKLHAFDMGTGMGNLVPGEVLFAAQLQNANAITSTRPIAGLWQPSLTDTTAELLVAPFYQKTGESSLQSSYALSAFTGNLVALPWMGVGTMAAA